MPQHELEKLQRSFYLRYYLSPPIFWNYVTKRAVYRLLDRNEWTLVFGTLRYLLTSPRRVGASSLAPPRSKVRGP